jgi:hypothetical protein
LGHKKQHQQEKKSAVYPGTQPTQTASPSQTNLQEHNSLGAAPVEGSAVIDRDGATPISVSAIFVQVDSPSGPVDRVYTIPVVRAVSRTGGGPCIAVLLMAGGDHVDVTGKDWRSKQGETGDDAKDTRGGEHDDDSFGGLRLFYEVSYHQEKLW